jgi:transcriptional regulator with XRE-family HTH domain
VTHSPTVRRRRLSAALRQYRRDAGLHADEVAKRLGWAGSKVTRIERNEWRLPTRKDVSAMLDVYGITDERRAAMLALVDQSRQRGWWEEYRDVLGGALPEFEVEASAITTFEALLVPGLLQTPRYAAAVFRGGRVMEPAEVERRVQARLARQVILDREQPPKLWAVIDEAAMLKHVGGPDVMREQLEHLVRMAARPNIGIQVVPNAVGAHASMTGPFTILDYPSPDDPSLVYVEQSATGDLFLEKTEEVDRYRLKYDHVRASALSADATVEYLSDLIDQLK